MCHPAPATILPTEHDHFGPQRLEALQHGARLRLGHVLPVEGDLDGTLGGSKRAVQTGTDLCFEPPAAFAGAILEIVLHAMAVGVQEMCQVRRGGLLDVRPADALRRETVDEPRDWCASSRVHQVREIELPR